VGLLVLSHVPWTSFYISVAFTYQHLHHRFMEEMNMHSIHVQNAYIFVRQTIVWNGKFMDVNCSKCVIGLKL
jgi:hypothetical protein